jgi:hypothetical protein
MKLETNVLKCPDTVSTPQTNEKQTYERNFLHVRCHFFKEINGNVAL